MLDAGTTSNQKEKTTQKMDGDIASLEVREPKGKKLIPTLTFQEWGRLSRILVPEWIVFADDGIWVITRSPPIHQSDQMVPQQHRK